MFCSGWSSSIPNYNPRDIVDNLLRKMNGEELVPMQPWFRGFEVRPRLDRMLAPL